MCTRRLLAVSVVLFFTFHSSPSDAYKILILPAHYKSHVLPMLAIGDGLTARGHEVTVLLGNTVHVDLAKIAVDQRFERYEDNGTDYEAWHERMTTMLMREGGATVQQLVEFVSPM